MAESSMWPCQVSQILDLSPHVRRIGFEGSALASFPADSASAYLKLVVPQEQTPELSPGLNLRALPADQRPLLRSFTIREVDPGQRTLAVDFVRHDPHGPAGRWLEQAQKGTEAVFLGPGETKMVPTGKAQVVLCGDLTALPAIAVNLEALPESAEGTAIVQVPSEDDIQNLAHPEGVNLLWMVENPGDAAAHAVSQAVADLGELPDGCYAWVAGELSMILKVRTHLRSLGMTPESMYVSSYWKHGVPDEKHKQLKREALAS